MPNVGWTGPAPVFVDANVWYSRTRRDWLGMLYTIPEVPPFQVHWTEDVMAEVLHSLRKAHPDWDGRRLTGIRDRLAGTFEAGRVDDFMIDGTYKGPDAHDAHVHAAAIACRAEMLITCNIADYEWNENESTYEVVHPDEFLVLVDDAVPRLVGVVVEQMQRYWFERRGESNLPMHLRTADCPEFAERVRRHLLRQA